MAKKQNITDSVDLTSLQSALEKSIASAFEKGMKKGTQSLSGAQFLQDLNSQMEELLKNQKAREFNDKVQATMLKKNISDKEAEVRVMAAQVVQQNKSLIKQQEINRELLKQEFMQARMNKDLAKMAQLRGEFAAAGKVIEGLKAENTLIVANAKELEKRLKGERQLTEEAEKQDKLRENFEKINKTLKERIGITDELIDQFRTPQMAGAALTAGVLSKMDKMHDKMKDLKSTGVTSAQAIDAMAKNISFSSIFGLSDTQGVLKGAVEQFGNINALSSETVNTLGTMAKEIGISGEEAAQVNAALSQMPGETTETAANAMKTTVEMAKMQGIAPGKVMKDIAKNSAAMALFSKDGAKGFGKAAIELHKMGLEIGSAAKMSEGLLNFEDSINAQMEASVMLGREINLDKARELALAGDLEGAAKEVLKNVGSAAEFDKMNVLQKQQLAKAAGLTVEELKKSLDAQEEQNKYFGEGASLGAQAMGNIVKYGEAGIGFFKENGMLLMSSVQFMSQFGLLQKVSNGLKAAGNFIAQQGFVQEIAHWVKQKAQWAAEKLHLTTKKAASVGGGAADAAGESMKKLGAGSNALKGGAGGAKSAMKDIAGGVKSFGSGKVFLGALGMVAAAAGLVALLAGLPTVFLLAIPGIGIGFKMNMKAIGQALSSLGQAAANPMTWLGIALLAAFGASLIPLTFALSLLAPVIEAFGNVILKVFQGVAIVIKAVAESFVMIFKAFAENWKILIPVGLGLVAVGYGLGVLGAASLMAFPGLLFTAVALGLMIPGLIAITLAAKSGGLDIAATALLNLSMAAPGLLMVGASMMAIAGGLGIIAIAGLAALPVLGMLIALAAVAPALVALGGALGGMFGGGGGEKEDQMNVLIEEVRGLRAAIQTPGVINMDGKKVGEIIRLTVNTSNVR